MDIQYRKINRADEPMLVPYLQKALTQPVTNRSFAWEFFKEPQSLLTVAETEGNIAGTQAFLPVKMWVNDKVVLSCKSETSYLDPAYRGHKIFEALYEYGVDACRENNVELIWGFTPAAKVWKNSLKFDVVELCIHEIYYDSPEFIDHALIKKFSSNGLVYQAKLFKAKLLNRRRSLNEKKILDAGRTTLTKQAQLSNPQDLLDFYKLLRQDRKISMHLQMDADYYNWRITSNPNIKYQTYFYYSAGKLQGYVAFNCTESTLMLGDISYLSEEAMIKIVSDLRKVMQSQKINKLYYFGNKGNALNKKTFSFFEKLGAKTETCAWANFVLKDLTAGKEHEELKTDDMYINGLWTEGFKL